jgi:Alr-MurF fusion protein
VKLSYHIAEISRIVGGELFLKSPSHVNISNVQFDSRAGGIDEQSLFFAFPGTLHDGHKYLAELAKSGAKNAIVSNREIVADYPDMNMVLVSNVKDALQKLAAYHRLQFKELNTITIGGSNGKTIVKEYLAELLELHYKIVKTPGSRNSQIGVPLSVLEIDADHEIGIFEAGISTTGEMDKLAQIIHPSVGIFTNLGSAHDAGFRSMEEKLHEKLKLYQHCEKLITESVNTDFSQLFKQLYPQKQLILWSFETLDSSSSGKVILTYNNDKIELNLPFTDTISVKNYLNCVVCSLELGLNRDAILNHRPIQHNMSMRLELQHGHSGNVIINDAYSNDLTSLRIALEYMSQQRTDKKKILVLGEMIETGKTQNELLHEINKLLEIHIVDQAYFIAWDIKEIEKIAWVCGFLAFDSIREATDYLLIHSPDNTMFLIKGSRRMALEHIAELLLLQSHSAELRIDLSALEKNLSFFGSAVPEHCKIMAVIKASAYGAGSIEIASLLAHKKVAYLAVAFMDEAIQLRHAGIKTPILVFNTEPEHIESLIKYDLEPEIFSVQQLNAVLEKFNGLHTNKELGVHLKIDTGMHRQGILFDEWQEVARIFLQSERLKLKSIMTHLAGSENRRMDEYSHQQVKSFMEISNYISNDLKEKPLRHVLNTNGILAFPEYTFEMVRLGIGLYGIAEAKEDSKALLPVHQLFGRVTQVKKLNSGDSVGYNRATLLERPTVMAVVNVGYADGLPRSAGRGKYALKLRNQLAPILGNVCMDSCMIDVTDIPGVTPGDKVLVFGDSLPIENLAKVCDTIPYEILCRISPRLVRKYMRK